MKISMVILYSLFMTLFAANALANPKVRKVAADGIYGWDIQCKGGKGLLVHAHQSDDDFYIDYEGVGISKNKVWAAAGLKGDDDMDSASLKHLAFHTDQTLSPGANVVIQIDREKVSGFGYGTGTIVIEKDTRNLNCFIRYGADETSFDKISATPFPKIKSPKN